MDAWARLSILVVASTIGAYAGIRAHERAALPVAPAAVVEPPVPAPTTLVAEVVIASPDTTWRKAQTAMGGLALLAPPTFGGILAAVAHVPVLAPEVDGGSPAYAVVDEEGRWVIAARVVGGQRARSALEASDASTTGVEVVAHAGSIDLMHPPGAWLGLAGNYVLIASDRVAIEMLGPYAFRTLPVRALPKSAIAANVRHAALAGAIRTTMDRRWEDLDRFLLAKDDEQRALHGGRAPDLADPKAIVAELDSIERAYAERVAAMESAEISLDVEGDALDARITLVTPRGSEVAAWVESLEGSAPTALATSRADALATLFWRSAPHDRIRAAHETSDALSRALGPRIPAADQTKLADSLERIARARAAWAVASVMAGSDTGALVRLATQDPDAIGASFTSIVELAQRPSWATWEKEALGVTKITRTGSVATFTTPATSIQASFATRSGEIDLGVGTSASAILSSGSAPITFKSDAKVWDWLRSLRSTVVWALVARPLILASSPRTDPLLVAWSHRRNNVVLDARAPFVVVRELVLSMKGL